ncbi:Archaemetzincin-2 like protein [Verticillium longisporum]|nr:Archaemetzincin-2 like protein [Verticillium longisporum]KAG7144363.1 Archaemetzincin-2 like protein [Verticillium longisporum]
MLLTHHDTYESPSDDFCCGRAYGGSRICLVSSFRYSPALDAHNDVDRSHAWPASHCAWWIDAVCDHDGETSESATPAEGGLRAAVMAARSGMLPRGKGCWGAVWLASVCRTASHELGHCLGLAHCALYACVMQSTAGVDEDGRQPPYLCPVCLAKTAYAVVGEAVKGRGKDKVAEMERREKVWIVERYRRIQTYSAQWKGTGTGMMKGYGAWAGHRVKELEERQS